MSMNNCIVKKKFQQTKVMETRNDVSKVHSAAGNYANVLISRQILKFPLTFIQRQSFVKKKQGETNKCFLTL